MRISDNLLVQLVGADLVICDESSGQESRPIPDIMEFTRMVHDQRAKGVASIEVDGIRIGGDAFDHLMLALGYFAGVVPHPKDSRQFSASDYE